MWKSPRRQPSANPRRRVFPSRSSARTCRGWCPGWTSRSSSGRQRLRDQYRATDFRFLARAPCRSKFVGEGRQVIETSTSRRAPRGAGDVQSRRFIADFAGASLNQGLAKAIRLSSTRTTILKPMTGGSRHLPGIFDNEFKAKFDAKKITYEHRLIDDMGCRHEWSAATSGPARTTRRRAVRHYRAG